MVQWFTSLAANRYAGSDARGLKTLREAASKRFRRGVVLYAGDTVVPMDAQITAVPMRNLWS